MDSRAAKQKDFPHKKERLSKVGGAPPPRGKTCLSGRADFASSSVRHHSRSDRKLVYLSKRGWREMGGGRNGMKRFPRIERGQGLLNEPRKILAPTHVQCTVYQTVSTRLVLLACMRTLWSIGNKFCFLCHRKLASSFSQKGAKLRSSTQFRKQVR